ncbi:hypothetical protein ACEPPN_005613 [Leptodophora sp. 'Broadleaf-Isolate-01']
MNRRLLEINILRPTRHAAAKGIMVSWPPRLNRPEFSPPHIRIAVPAKFMLARNWQSRRSEWYCIPIRIGDYCKVHVGPKLAVSPVRVVLHSNTNRRLLEINILRPTRHAAAKGIMVSWPPRLNRPEFSPPHIRIAVPAKFMLVRNWQSRWLEWYCIPIRIGDYWKSISSA